MNEGFTAALTLCENRTDLDEEEEIFSNDLLPDLLLSEVLDQIPKHLTKRYMVPMLNTGKKR